MNGVEFLQSLDPLEAMPMAKPWAFVITKIERGELLAQATPAEAHQNPFGVVQGGFAATVLDIALGLVTITLFEDASKTMAATTDLFVRYFAPILATTGELRIRARIVHQQGKTIVAEAFLEDLDGMKYAYAQSNCIAAKRTR